MTLPEIVAVVTRMQDALDRKYLTTGMTEPEYDAGCKQITAWAINQHAGAARATALVGED